MSGPRALCLARYRERHSVARTKSDRVDAPLLANILRTDRAAHWPLPADLELAQAVAVLARAQRDAVWNRQQVANQLRSLLCEYYPAFLEAFQGRGPVVWRIRMLALTWQSRRLQLRPPA